MAGNINVYTMGRLPDGRTFPCDMHKPEIGGDTIAHELGHYLNLGESSCASAIMGPTSLRSFNGQLIRTKARRILSSECNLADNMSFTPYEEEEWECMQDPEPCTGTSPILLDLDNNGFNLAREPVFFDIDADGELDLISWTRPDQQDAFLCFDRNGNGLIDDGSELFGDSTPMASGYTASNGYIALAELDEGYGGNFDRQITADDARFSELCLWLDENHNGYSEPEELKDLDDFGIVAIGLDYSESKGEDRFGNRFPFIGVAWKLEGEEFKKVLTTDVFFVIYN